MWQQKDFETALRYSYATMLHFLSALSALLEAYSFSPHSVKILLDLAWIQFCRTTIFSQERTGCVAFLHCVKNRVVEKSLRIHTVIFLSISLF